MTTQLFFYWFQGRNLKGDEQNFKRDVGGGDVKNGYNQISRGKSFFLYHSKLMSRFVSVSPDTTL